MELNSLLNKTNAYQVFKKDIEMGTLSHAYLIVCEDGVMLEDYLKAFAKTLFCDSEEYCNDCRTCRLIDSKTLTDVKFYPTGDKIKVGDVDDIVLKAYVKPLEFDKKAFVLLNAHEMNAQAQNKLLKTLEEPPQNTYLILGAKTAYPLLSTVLSRVKRLDIPSFNKDALTAYLNENYKEKSAEIQNAVNLCNGKLGDALNILNDSDNQQVTNLCYDILLGLKSSKDAYRYVGKITKENYRQVLSSMIKTITNAITVKSGNALKIDNENINSITVISNTYSYGALIYMVEKFIELERLVNFNLNVNAVADGIIFGILEGKHKWQK